MAERFPPFGTVPTRPRCHYCGGVIVVDLHADDDLWEAVMRDKFGTGYACINCFASRADEKLIDWAPHVRLIPLSLAGQMSVQADAQAAAEPNSIRAFLHALQARNEKDNGLFPQVASEVEADAKALHRVLAVMDFYHPSGRTA